MYIYLYLCMCVCVCVCDDDAGKSMHVYLCLANTLTHWLENRTVYGCTLFGVLLCSDTFTGLCWFTYVIVGHCSV